MGNKESEFKSYIIILIIVVLCITILIFETVNHRLALNDFRVYYEATKAMLTNGQVYKIAWGLDSGYFKYSPFILLLFTPFAILPFSVSGIIYSVLIIIALIFSVLNTQSIAAGYLFGRRIKYESLALIIGLVTISNHIYRELHLGNTNIILMLLVLISLKLVLKGKDFWGGILFTFALLLKPYLLLLVIVPFFHKKWKMFLGIISMLGLQAVIMIILWGSLKTSAFHAEWISTMFTHLEGNNSNNIAFFLDTFIGIGHSAISSYLIIIVSALLLSAFILYNSLLRSGQPINLIQLQKNYSIEWLLVFAALPSIVNTDTEHFMSALPLVIFLLYHQMQKQNYTLTVFLLIAFILYGTNSNDLVGDPIGNFYDRIGAIGIGNILIILLSILVYSREYKNTLSLRNEEEV